MNFFMTKLWLTAGYQRQPSGLMDCWHHNLLQATWRAISIWEEAPQNKNKEGMTDCRDSHQDWLIGCSHHNNKESAESNFNTSRKVPENIEWGSKSLKTKKQGSHKWRAVSFQRISDIFKKFLKIFRKISSSF